MASGSYLRIAVLPGDGIGVEVMDACLTVLGALSEKTGRRFEWSKLPGGASLYRDTGNAFPDESMRECERADAILFGAMGLPDVRYPDGTEIAPQLDIRVNLDLYAGVRPIRAIPGLHGPLRDPRAEQIGLRHPARANRGPLLVARARHHAGCGYGGRHLAHHAARLRAHLRLRLPLAARRKAQRTRRQSDMRGQSRRCAPSPSRTRSSASAPDISPQLASDTCNIDAMALNFVRQP
jgi:3-isopropylmalate dehydrogenase